MSATLCRLTGNRDIHWNIPNWPFQIGRKKWKKSPRDKKKESLKHQLVHLTDRWELSVTKCPFSCNAVNITSRNGCLGIYLMDYFLFAILLSSSRVRPCFMLKTQTLSYCQPSFFSFWRIAICKGECLNRAVANDCTCLWVKLWRKALCMLRKFPQIIWD